MEPQQQGAAVEAAKARLRAVEAAEAAWRAAVREAEEAVRAAMETIVHVNRVERPEPTLCGAILASGPRKGQPCPCRPVSGTGGFCGRHRQDVKPPRLPRDLDTTCCACLEPTEAKLVCSHSMCSGCQDKWFTRRQKTTCPCCRRRVVSPRVM